MLVNTVIKKEKSENTHLSIFDLRTFEAPFLRIVFFIEKNHGGAQCFPFSIA